MKCVYYYKMRQIIKKYLLLEKCKTNEKQPKCLNEKWKKKVATKLQTEFDTHVDNRIFSAISDRSRLFLVCLHIRWAIFVTKSWRISMKMNEMSTIMTCKSNMQQKWNYGWKFCRPFFFSVFQSTMNAVMIAKNNWNEMLLFFPPVI